MRVKTKWIRFEIFSNKKLFCENNRTCTIIVHINQVLGYVRKTIELSVRKEKPSFLDSKMSTTEDTESGYSTTGTDYTTETNENNETETASEDQENPPETTTEDTTTTETQNEEHKEEEEKQEEEKEKLEPLPEIEPEPEKDPLEGVVYEDDPKVPLNPYGDKYYWEARYINDPEAFEWYQEPDVLSSVFKEYIDPEEGRVLVVGNGTSLTPSVIAQNGCESCVAIDFAKSAVKVMKKQNKELENVQIKQMDVRELNFPEGDFQAIIDKACIDSVLYLGDAEVNQMMAEISRVLKRRGVYICLSCHGPDDMKRYFDNPAELLLELEKVTEIPKPLPSEVPHYLYIVRKVTKLLT